MARPRRAGRHPEVEAVKLILPYPVSANRYWAQHVPKGWTRAVTYVTAAAKAYREEVGWIAKQAGLRRPVAYPLELRFTLVPANGVRMDLSNALKVAEDALQGIAFVNDKQTRKIVAEVLQPDGHARLEVEILAYEPAPMAPFLWSEIP